MSEDRWWHPVVGIPIIGLILVVAGVALFISLMFVFYTFGFVGCGAANVPIGECWGGRGFWEWLN